MDRVLQPSILMQMVDSDGFIRTFEMTVEQFHQLRFSTALVLKVYFFKNKYL